MNGFTRTKSVSEFNGFMVQADLFAAQRMNGFMKSVFEFNEGSIVLNQQSWSAKKVIFFLILALANRGSRSTNFAQ